MNVLMYGWEYPPHISGGLGVACHAIVQALIKKNISINLVLPYDLSGMVVKNKLSKLHIFGLGKTSSSPDKNALNIYKIDSLLHPYLSPQDYQTIFVKSTQQSEYLRNLPQHIAQHYWHNFAGANLTGNYGHDLFSEVLRYAEVAGDVATQVKHQVIHAHDWMTILAGIKAKYLSKRKLIFHVHALEIDRSGIEHINQQIFDIEKYGMEQADKIISVSQYTKDLIVRYYGIPDNKIEVVHNGINDSYAKNEQRKVSDRKMVLFVGRVTHQKGPYFFVEIAKKILAKRPEVEFVIAGTGNLLREMIERVAAARIGQNVHFTGFLDPEKIKDVYRLADVYVMPSVSEPFGLSCLEALAHDVPVVLSKQSGAAEVLRHALHADFWDVNEMASKILALLDFRALRQESLGHVKSEMRNLTWDKAGNKISSLYERLS